MSGIDQDLRLRARGARQQKRHAPVGDVGVVEGRLKWLVLHQKPLFGRQSPMALLQHVSEPLLTLPDVRGSGIVGAVGKPHGNVAALETSCNLNAVFGVVQRALANRWIRIAEGTVLVFLILEESGVDRTGKNSIAPGIFLDVAGAVGAVRTVPKYMQCH